MEIIYSFYNLIPVTLSQSLIYTFVTMGIMIPFRLLSFPDLTSEGSFPLGACMCGALLTAGYDPVTSTLAAVFAGFLAGSFTAFIHLKFKINTLLCGILVMTMLYSINLRILGRPNVALFSIDNLFNSFGSDLNMDLTWKNLFLGGMILSILVSLYWFLNTESGMSLRAVGVNPTMASAQGISQWTYIMLGVGIANSFNALGGAILAQSQGYADVGMGIGVLINGLAALIIGESFVGNATVLRQIVAVVLGAVVYYHMVSLGLSLGLVPSDLKFATGAFVLLALIMPNKRRGTVKEEKMREAVA